MAILTFYEAQRLYFLYLFRQNGLPSVVNGKIVINNVDGFQGQGREVIILSCVRSTIDGAVPNSIGFLSKPNRPNVAITRAKSGLIVVGNPHVLRMNTYWRDFISSFTSTETMVYDTPTWLDKYTKSPPETWYNENGYIEFPEPTAQEALICEIEESLPGYEDQVVVDEYMNPDCDPMETQ